MSISGQSAERTVIAWGRTGIAAAGLGVLLLRLGLERQSPAELIGAALTLVSAAGFGLHGRLSYLRARTSLLALQILTASLALAGLLTCVALL